MFGFLRAAGYAAAAIGAALTPTFADPSLAWDVDAAPVTSSYIDHAAANLDAAALEAQPAEAPKTLSHDIHFSSQIAEHAVAAVVESPAEKEEGKLSGLSLASLVDEHAASSVSDDELECLAGAVYFESKGEPLAGQLAVAEVVINRTKSGKYPTTICGVVKQRSQFSFVRGGRIPPISKDSAAWRKAVAIAHIAKQDLADSPVPSALSFHATYVSPGWRLKRLGSVGRHIFYR